MSSEQPEYQQWTFTEGNLAHYEGLSLGFGEILQGRTFQTILDEFKWKHRNVRVVAGDIMGYGFVLDELAIDRGLAVALGTHPNRPHGEYVVGDVLSDGTWQMVKGWLGSDRFALLLVRPIAAFGVASPIDVPLFGRLVQNMKDVLAKDGRAFVQIPANILPHVHTVAETFRRRHRLNVAVDSPMAMEIVRK